MANAVVRLALAGLGLAMVATGASAEVLNDHDNGPLTGYFGIPDSTEGAILAPRGKSRWHVSVLTSSHSISDRRLGERIVLDGETTQLSIVWRHGVGERLEIGFEVPWLWHESGGLDSLVQTWHDVLGFPGGFRGTRPNDTLEFVYEGPGGTLIDFRRNTKGIGDVRLLAGWRVLARDDHAIALRAGIKFPTGDSADLLGSGGTDLSFGIAGDLDTLFGLQGLSGFYRAHAILLGEPDLLADRHRDVAGLVSFGFGYWLGERVELRIQGAVRTALYDSTIEVLGDPAGTATFGGNIRLGSDYVLTLAVSEDVKVRSAPDVSFGLGLRYRPE